MATSKPADQALPDNLSRRIMVLIKRDQTTATPRVVWRHEFPILEAVFGEGNVTEVDRDSLDEGYTAKLSPTLMPFNKSQDAPRKPSDVASLDFAFIGSPQGEYERLAMVYGKHNEINQTFVENVYGRFGAGLFARVLGKPRLADLPADQLRSLALAWGYSLPISTKDSSAEERKEAADAHYKFNTMKAPELVKLAEELGVELGV